MKFKFLCVIPLLLLSFGALVAQQKHYTREDYLLVIKYSTQKLLEDSLKNEEYFKSRAEAHYAVEDFKNALKDFNSYLRLNPKDSYTYYNRGILKNDIGSFDGAIQDFSAAIKYSSANPSDFYFARGSVNQSLKHYAKAISDYNIALKHSPDNKDALNNLGLLFIEKKDFQAAVPWFDKALKLNSDLVNSLFNRAYALIELGRGKEALADLEHALAISPDNPYANNYMGYYFYVQNEKQEACRYFKIAAANGASPIISDKTYCE